MKPLRVKLKLHFFVQKLLFLLSKEKQLVFSQIFKFFCCGSQSVVCRPMNISITLGTYQKWNFRGSTPDLLSQKYWLYFNKPSGDLDTCQSLGLCFQHHKHVNVMLSNCNISSIFLSIKIISSISKLQSKLSSLKSSSLF